MRIKAQMPDFIKDLKMQLSKSGLMPVYLLSSDEPCLIYATCDCIRDCAKTKGFFERDVFDINAKFDWSLFTDATEALSLFSNLKTIELRFPNKPDANASKHLLAYFERPSTDLLIIISSPRLDAATLKSKWVTALDKIGAILVMYPPELATLPAWVNTQALRIGVNLDQDARQFLSAHDEGNLLAIIQELDRLKVLYGQELITVAKLQEMMTESARFGVFDLPDAILTGDLIRVKRMLDTLKQEGEEPVLINWALQKEIRILAKIITATKQGQGLDQALTGVWEKRKPLYRQAVSRFNPERIKILLDMCVEIDRAIKGNLKENPWNAILRVSFALAGKSFLPLSSEPKI